MNLMNSGIKFNPKLLLVGLLVAAGVSTYVVKIKEAKAAGVSGLSGTYSCMTNRNFAPMMTYMQGSTGVGANTLATFNFDTGGVEIAVYTNSAWGTSNPTAQVGSTTGTFTQATGPITGSYTLSATVTGNSNPIKMNVLPSNAGNTLFVSMTPSTGNGGTPETGVCQKQ